MARHLTFHLLGLIRRSRYSLVTLSTLGYGDSVAVARAARSLSALENWPGSSSR